MIYTELTKKALILAYREHDGQVDKAGVPYIYHPIHVAEQMETEREVCVALLHDILEDTAIVPEELRQMGFPDEYVDDIKYLTRAPGETYAEYIQLLADKPVPRKVKIADLKHNIDLTRLPKVTEQDIKRKKRYEKFLKILEMK